MKILKNQIQNLNPIPEKKNPDSRNPQVLKAARMYEQTFLNEMVKAMRGSVQKSDLIQENMAEKIFKDQLFDKHVETWTQNGGVGMADLIYDEIMEKYFAQQGIRPQGALPVNRAQMHALKDSEGAGEETGQVVDVKENGLYGTKNIRRRSVKE